MSRPLFSVLVPTRERANTLRHTLATVASQGREDYEIVVADNCGGPETRRVVDELASPLVRYTRSDRVLAMAENWERGLALCTGDYVTVLGDDDAFLPSTLQMAERLISATDAELLSWHTQTYWWPDTIAYWNRSRLYLTFGNGATFVDSRPVLEQFFAGEVSFGMIPMIYNAFFHRRLVEEARRRHGGFFVPVDVSPDVSSGIVGLHLTRRYAYSNRALTLRGNSAKSNGTAHWMRSLGAKQREEYQREERIGLRDMVHPSLVPSPNLHILIASTKLKCKERFFPDDAALTVDPRKLVATMVAGLNHDPAAYEENLRDAQDLAAKIGMVIDPGTIPPKAFGERPSGWGPMVDQQGHIEGLSVNCELAGALDVAAAARLVEALSPPAETFLAGMPVEAGASAPGVSYDPAPAAGPAASDGSSRLPFLGRLLADLFRRRPPV